MPKVQQSTLARFLFVMLNHHALHIHTGIDNLVNTIFSTGLLQQGKQLCRADTAVLDHLAHTVTKEHIRQGTQHLRINQHQNRLVKGTAQILAHRQIHAGFTAHRGVHLSQQCRGYLHKINAPQINGSRKSGHIAAHTAAQRNHQVAPRQPLPGHIIHHIQHGLRLLGRLTGVKYQGAHLKVCALQRLHHPVAVQRVHIAIADQANALGAGHATHQACYSRPSSMRISYGLPVCTVIFCISRSPP